MILELAKPKNTLALVAGVVSIFFEKVGAASPPIMASTNGSSAIEPDDLTKINGIGPTFAQRLNAAGITTFADLAKADADYVRLVAHVEVWQGDPKAWIAEAKTLI